MTRMIYAFLTAVAVLVMLSAPPAFAEPYWIAWEGDTFPEEGEWNRAYGNWDGPGEGQAFRTLHDGVMTIDSLHDQGVYDFYWLERPGAIDPDPGELFVMEWSLRVDEVVPDYPTVPFDPEAGVMSDSRNAVGFAFGVDCFESAFEHLTFTLDMTTTRQFRLESSDMSSYRLLVDGTLFHSGEFIPVVSDSYVGWGDSAQGASSLHHWDYFRFGVLPEPSTLILSGLILTMCRNRRS